MNAPYKLLSISYNAKHIYSFSSKYLCKCLSRERPVVNIAILKLQNVALILSHYFHICTCYIPMIKSLNDIWHLRKTELLNNMYQCGHTSGIFSSDSSFLKLKLLRVEKKSMTHRYGWVGCHQSRSINVYLQGQHSQWEFIEQKGLSHTMHHHTHVRVTTGAQAHTERQRGERQMVQGVLYIIPPTLIIPTKLGSTDFTWSTTSLHKLGNYSRSGNFHRW